jgi:catechol 2,3-dioxygenase-like lactoylglutathione lyase family enzyme
MFDHIGLKVKDVEASVRFYEAALGELGHALCTRDAASAGLGPKGAPALWLYAAAKGAKAPGAHLAFRAQDRTAVDRFHKAGIAAGGRDHGAPGVREDYGPKYYAAFLIDPDGNNVEAVCMR